MSIRKYQMLFEIHLKHNYYRSGLCRDLTLQPTTECQHLMKQHRMLMKPNADGLAVIYQAEADGSALIQTITAPLRLSFILKLANPQLYSFSDLEFKQGQQYFLSNQPKVAARDQEIYLTENRQNTEQPDLYLGSKDVRIFKPSVFDWPVDASGEEEVEVLIKEESGKTIVEKKIKETIRFGVDLRQEPDGWYTIESEKGEGSPMTFYHSWEMREQDFGLVDIIVDPKDEQLFPKDESIPQFVLALNRRSTIWRYFIINRSMKDNPVFTVIDKTDTFSFKPAVEDTLPNGDTAIRIDAAQAIDLQEGRGAQFRLAIDQYPDGPEGRSNRQFINLPNAGIEQIQIKNDGESIVVYSDMYVYL